ncbi:MAG: FMN-binding protein [bacterium]|nr:FMN-binding protein [bacterium]
MKEIFKLSLTLALICAVAGAALAATHGVTSVLIAERQEIELKSALSELLPEANTYQMTQVERLKYYKGYENGMFVGAVMVAAANGYGGAINLLVVVDTEGKVRKVRVTGHSETAGIGNKIEKLSFLNQFIGKSVKDQVIVGKDINAVSGATISSKAVAAGVRQALQNHLVYVTDNK